MEYSQFLENKRRYVIPTGFHTNDLNKNLFDFQKSIVQWGLRKGKCAFFEDTGLGKTIQLLAFAEAVCKHENGSVIILSPLAVAEQTKNEGSKFGIDVNICESKDDVKQGINITNYEKIHKFDMSVFDGVILDESSIIKNQYGKIKNQIIEAFKDTKYKLCCTATPSPNDFTEIGTHAEFLGVMSTSEMLATFFINDSMGKKGTGIKGWRLKRHAEKEFFKWLASWSVMIKNPSDIGFDGSRYVLPKLNIIEHIIETSPDETSLFVEYAETFQEKNKARKETLEEKALMINDIISSTDNCLIWCNYNDESGYLHKMIKDSVEVKGNDKSEHKKNSMIGFSNNEVKYLISKPSICGFGMNWQNCHDMVFCGLSDSYEQFYQAVRRCYRFGQKKEVNVHVVISEKEMSILLNIKRKQAQHERMMTEMVSVIGDLSKEQMMNLKINHTEYNPSKEMTLPDFLGG